MHPTGTMSRFSLFFNQNLTRFLVILTYMTSIKWRDMLCSWKRILNTVNMLNPKLICSFCVMPIKMPTLMNNTECFMKPEVFWTVL